MSDLIETFVYFYLIQKVSKSEQNCANFWQIRFSSEFWHFFVPYLNQQQWQCQSLSKLDKWKYFENVCVMIQITKLAYIPIKWVLYY